MARDTVPNGESWSPIQARCNPFYMDFGTIREGLVLEGSVQILSASKAGLVQVSDLLEFAEPTRGPRGLIWLFRLKSLMPGSYHEKITFHTDSGDALLLVFVEVRERKSTNRNVLFCASPFNALSHSDVPINLKYLMRELDLSIAAQHRMPEDLDPFQCVVLTGGGLQSLVDGAKDRCFQYLERGGTIIILANQFTRNSVMWANHITEPYGIYIEDREYGEVLCGEPHMAADTLTHRVRRLRFFRPSPLAISPPAKALVQNPKSPTEAFVACSRAAGNLLVISISMLEDLICTNWPFDNGQLFANAISQGQRI